MREHVTGEGLIGMVPPTYRSLVRDKTAADQAYTLLLFVHAPRDVVISRPVRQALRRLGDAASENLLAVGTTFTAEAKELLCQHDGVVVEQRKTKWTDASAAERQL